MTGGVRQAVEARSAAAAQTLATAPRWAVFLAVLAVVAGGLLLHGLPALVLLATLAFFLGWLAYLAWPALAAGQRVLRLLTVALVAAAAIARFTA